MCAPATATPLGDAPSPCYQSPDLPRNAGELLAERVDSTFGWCRYDFRYKSTHGSGNQPVAQSMELTGPVMTLEYGLPLGAGKRFVFGANVGIPEGDKKEQIVFRGDNVGLSRMDTTRTRQTYGTAFTHICFSKNFGLEAAVPYGDLKEMIGPALVHLTLQSCNYSGTRFQIGIGTGWSSTTNYSKTIDFVSEKWTVERNTNLSAYANISIPTGDSYAIGLSAWYLKQKIKFGGDWFDCPEDNENLWQYALTGTYSFF